VFHEKTKPASYDPYELVLSTKKISTGVFKRDPRRLLCDKHRVKCENARSFLLHLTERTNKKIETCIGLTTQRVSITTLQGPFVPLMSIAAIKTKAGASFGRYASKGAAYAVRAICLSLVDLPLGDYCIAWILEFLIGHKAALAFECITTNGVRFTNKTKKEVLKKLNERTCLVSVVTAVRKSVESIRSSKQLSNKK